MGPKLMFASQHTQTILMEMILGDQRYAGDANATVLGTPLVLILLGNQK